MSVGKERPLLHLLRLFLFRANEVTLSDNQSNDGAGGVALVKP